MNHVNYFRDLLDSKPDYRKNVLLIFSIKNDNDFLTECGYLKSDINRLSREYKNILIEQNEENLNYIKKSRRIYYRSDFD